MLRACDVDCVEACGPGEIALEGRLALHRAVCRRVAAAHAAGAFSGMVSGAGGGGFLMFLCDPTRRSDVMRAVKAGGGELSTVGFSMDGATAWRVR